MIPNKIKPAIAAAALMIASGTASALTVDKSFEYSCDFPRSGTNPVIVDIHTEIPDTLTIGETILPYTVEIDTHLLGNIWREFEQAIIANFEGEITSGITLTGNGNYHLDIPLTSAFPLMPVLGAEPEDFAIHVTTETDSISNLVASNWGAAEFVIQDKLYLKFRGFHPTAFGGASVFVDGRSDPNDNNAFTVECDLISPDNFIASVSIDHGSIPGPQIESVDFGTVLVGDSRSKTIAVPNTGIENLIINSISLNGDESISETNNCSFVAVNNICEIELTYRPTSIGTHSADLRIASNDADDPVIMTPVFGHAIIAMEAHIAEIYPVDIGNAVIGESVEIIINIYNDGTADLIISDAVTSSSAFAVDASDCIAAPIPPNEACNIIVLFTASAIGHFSAALTIKTNIEDVTVALSGAGVEGGCFDSVGCCPDTPYFDICYHPSYFTAFFIGGTTNLGKTIDPVTITGQIQIEYFLPSDAFEAQLSIDQTYGVFPFFGLLKTLAAIDLKQNGIATGSQNSLGEKYLHTKMFIKLPDVYITLFGFNIRIAGGDNCGTTETVNMDLYGTDFIDLDAGGTLNGSYSIPKIEQCGVFNNIVNAMLAGENNSIEMDLSPEF